MRLPATLLVLLLSTTAHAEPLCGALGSPAPELKHISRGFSHGHTGLDMMAPFGSPIRAAAGGTVVYAGWYYAYGNIIDIQHADGVITRYAHMAGFAPGIRDRQPVAAGQVIGQVGQTGNAHGPHVHFEVRLNGRPVDPRPFLAGTACATRPLIEEARVPEPRRRRH